MNRIGTNNDSHPDHTDGNGQARGSRARRSAGKQRKPVVITGGAGFVGTNLAHRLLSQGIPVLLYDNLSRPGVEQNLQWLKNTHGSLVQLRRADIRDFDALLEVVGNASQVFHFAAQVAVTTSLVDPFLDFEINARGSLNLLEALRRQPHPPPLVFTSTNKVYGDLSDVKLRTHLGRYEPQTPTYRRYGFSENRPLNFHSPYGCSKGAACQYVLDYARTFDLPTVVFRMSCIYGPHQFGTEDQGWVAHFLLKALNEEPITIYGDGRQVRDVLFVDDLVDAFMLAQGHMDSIAGEVFNIGGGPSNTISLLELLDLINILQSHRPKTKALFSDWRTADQQYYVSDTRKFSQVTGWNPRIGVREGVRALYHWLREWRTPAPPRIQPGRNGARSRGIASSETGAYPRNGHGTTPARSTLRRRSSRRLQRSQEQDTTKESIIVTAV